MDLRQENSIEFFARRCRKSASACLATQQHEGATGKNLLIYFG